jgi:hypothetical protein
MDAIAHLFSRAMPSDECLIWTGARTHNGYAHARVKSKYVRVHRFVYEAIRGPIPQGLQLDHLCRNRACINPLHLEPVTGKENMRRGIGNQNKEKTHCIRGHELSGDNLYVFGKMRTCRACRRIRYADHTARRN